MTREDFIAHALTNADDLAALFQEIRKKSVKEHRFDFNYSLAEGKVAENLIQGLLEGDTSVEVKLDGRVGDTGNILIEYGHSYPRKPFEPSGIMTSEADWWAFVFGGELYQSDVAVFIKRERLKKVMEAFGRPNKQSGKSGNSDFLLISKNDLLRTDI